MHMTAPGRLVSNTDANGSHLTLLCSAKSEGSACSSNGISHHDDTLVRHDDTLVSHDDTLVRHGLMSADSRVWSGHAVCQSQEPCML